MKHETQDGGGLKASRHRGRWLAQDDDAVLSCLCNLGWGWRPASLRLAQGGAVAGHPTLLRGTRRPPQVLSQLLNWTFQALDSVHSVHSGRCCSPMPGPWTYKRATARPHWVAISKLAGEVHNPGHPRHHHRLTDIFSPKLASR
jgi:hypothetical protein